MSAKGPTYDGRDLFRSFFDVAHLGDQSTKVRPGLDLRAEVDTVVGFSDTTLRNVKMLLQKRSNKLTSLDARGVLEGGKPFAAEVRHEAGQNRRLRAEAMDAGQLFKLVGFYPNAVGGAVNLEVNLDGQGPAERTGTLWVRDFLVLGDPIISEVLQSADGTPTSGQRRTVAREQFEFEIMRVPFSVGHGQFVMHDAAHQRPAGERVHARQGRLQGADAQCRRHLRADVGPHAGAGPDSGARPAAHRPARAKASSASPSPSRARWRSRR